MANPPGPRRLLPVIALAMLLLAVTAPAAAYTDSRIFTDTYSASAYGAFGGSPGGFDEMDSIWVSDIHYFSDLQHIALVTDAVGASSFAGYPETGFTSVVGSVDNNTIFSGRIAYNINYDQSGQFINIVLWIDDISNWDAHAYTGEKRIDLVWNREIVPAFSVQYTTSTSTTGDSSQQFTDRPAAIAGVGGFSGNVLRNPWGEQNLYLVSSGWHNTVDVNYNDIDGYTIDLYRHGYFSTYIIADTVMGVTLASQPWSATDRRISIPRELLINPEINLTVQSQRGLLFVWMINPIASPDSTTATVYVQSSQTGALLADAHLSILAAAGGTETEIINATLPAGTATYTLQPTGGGSPNPDYYRAVATVPGYTQIVENHSFTLTRPQDVIIDMRPDSGGPSNPDLCYLEFYVRDLNANPIPSASVQCENRIKTTNSAGYVLFEVAKNSTHPYVVKKSGYVTIEGTATVEALPRYVCNIVLGPGSVPTHTPTLAPGETPTVPGATPTLPPGRIISDDDRRRSENQVIDMIYVFGVPIAIFALIGTLMYLVGAGTGGSRSRRRRR